MECNNKYRVIVGDCIEAMRTLPDQSVNCCVTSPPYYGLRDYGVVGQIGLEESPDQYIQKMVDVFREVRRVLRDDGTVWLNIGDSYSAPNSGNHGYRDGRSNRAERSAAGVPVGYKPKDLLGIPWMLAFALRADGWYLRQDIIWHKTNPMPESVRDRCTKAHEYIFLLSKSPKYHFDHEAFKEDSASRKSAGNKSHKYTAAYEESETEEHRTKAGLLKLSNVTWEKRNRRSVWSVGTKPYKGAHFATFPPDLIAPCILAGCPKDGVVLDPFGGSGTTAGVALRNGRTAILCELNPDYAELIPARVESIAATLDKVG